jgi:2-polyprenyl-3-methyl-5-hydroxy-6-metoxy-1,4-benzoquinol methylase
MLAQQLVARVDRFMATHSWSHNEWYHPWILRQLPRTMSRALDVGCGTGDLVRVLARRSATVEGIDIDPTVLGLARQASSLSERTSFSLASVLDLPARQRYDAITAVAVLHHVPLADALRRLADALVPGGTLLIVGCYREESAGDRALSLAAVPANMAIGLYKSRGRKVAPPLSMSAPTAPATETLSVIRDVAHDLLPGFSLRRGLFWRYLLRYTAPR